MVNYKTEDIRVKKLAFRKEAQERIVADKFSLSVFFLCVFSILGQIGLILSSLGKLPPMIPLYHSRPWGEKMLAATYTIWILPILAATFFVLNFFIAFFLVKDNPFLLKVLVTFALVACLASLYDVFKIVSLLV